MPPSYIRVRAVVWAYGRGQTDRHTDTQTRVITIHFASSTTHAKCNERAVAFCTVMMGLGQMFIRALTALLDQIITTYHSTDNHRS